MKLIMENFRNYIKEEEDGVMPPIPNIVGPWDANAVEEWLTDKIWVNDDDVADDITFAWERTLRSNPEEWVKKTMEFNNNNFTQLEADGYWTSAYSGGTEREEQEQTIRDGVYSFLGN